MPPVPVLTTDLEAAIRRAARGSAVPADQVAAILAAVLAELDRCRAVLRSVEWVSDHEGGLDLYCPSCGGQPILGHRDGCALAVLLGR